MTEFSNKYDLEERIAKFGGCVIELYKTIRQEAQELTLIFGKILSTMNKERIQN